ncbi:hypothetical protein KEM60_00132 [Austwickia sp. TVS 96-490-7B]|uniref:hypothetical protein n=1 Tax=Austwickia sp. TVS 96-490-7B TaxID=2830843 RepID=UPI001C58F3C1|nr:hypothetical protein [Austwickia sp. TVS 96-490-7B]MBW3083949.1 hypothetical protein [Austwickia sp. TVS 96-490-7B]
MKLQMQVGHHAAVAEEIFLPVALPLVQEESASLGNRARPSQVAKAGTAGVRTGGLVVEEEVESSVVAGEQVRMLISQTVGETKPPVGAVAVRELSSQFLI